jgi:hypothetical protein
VQSHLYALDLRTIALASETGTDSDKGITIPSKVVNDLGAFNDFADVDASLTWPQTTDTLSMPMGNQIININLRTGERRIDLSVEDAEFCAASWTPDGSQLFFAVCRPVYSNPDTTGPPAQLYVYTPQTR